MDADQVLAANLHSLVLELEECEDTITPDMISEKNLNRLITCCRDRCREIERAHPHSGDAPAWLAELRARNTDSRTSLMQPPS